MQMQEEFYLKKKKHHQKKAPSNKIQMTDVSEVVAKLEIKTTKNVWKTQKTKVCTNGNAGRPSPRQSCL